MGVFKLNLTKTMKRKATSLTLGYDMCLQSDQPITVADTKQTGDGKILPSGSDSSRTIPIQSVLNCFPNEIVKQQLGKCRASLTLFELEHIEHAMISWVHRSHGTCKLYVGYNSNPLSHSLNAGLKVEVELLTITCQAY